MTRRIQQLIGPPFLDMEGGPFLSGQVDRWTVHFKNFGERYQNFLEPTVRPATPSKGVTIQLVELASEM